MTAHPAAPPLDLELDHHLLVHALAGEAAYDWSFADGGCSFDLGRPHAMVRLDGFPGYAHDPALVHSTAAQVLEVWPPAGDLTYWLPDREVVGRANGFAERLWSDGRSNWSAHIVLSGKRTPLHPGMTRFLVAHELGHHVEWWLERARGLEEDEIRQDYCALRGLEYHRATGGRWHSAIGEIFADDFRLLVAGVELEHWPHPGIERPGPAEVDWWAEALADWTHHLRDEPDEPCPDDPDGLHHQGCGCDVL